MIENYDVYGVKMNLVLRMKEVLHDQVIKGGTHSRDGLYKSITRAIFRPAELIREKELEELCFSRGVVISYRERYVIYKPFIRGVFPTHWMLVGHPTTDPE